MKPFQPPTKARATNALIITCIVVHLLLLVGGSAFAMQAVMRAGLIPARLTGVLELGAAAVPAPLTLITSLFLHGGVLHLGLNMVFLAFVGRLVEWVIGPAKLLLLYAAGGLAGGLLQTLVMPESTLPVIGASGAIAAVFACYATLFARRRANPRRVLGITISSEFLTALWFAVVWIGLQLMTGAALNGAGGGVAIWSHIGGFVAGLVFAQPLLRRRRLDLL